ncbi:hypothetical protein PT974_02758 [Cladobotryum mycophilum]|uniref:Uncharacterized protein n=1 Tax=Cladobotryum mycophilum TaxID=491253 RepID=A0ABR0SZ71_9HYPO
MPYMNGNKNEKRHVVVIGGGAAGMSCAATLANHPEKFRVTIFEASNVVGGQAISIPLDEAKYGAPWMNNGVQGGSQVLRSPPQEVQLEVAFGKGESGFWTNCFPSKLIEKHASDIRKYGFFLKVIKWTMPVLGLFPISVMLRFFFFGKDFANTMVYPLIALFLGTGNQTPNVPAAIVERLFNDPNMKLWDYDSSTLLPNRPTMYTFDHLHEFYGKWKDDLVAKGVAIRTNTEVVKVLSRSKKGINLQVKNTSSGETTEEKFNEMVFCVLADDALRILGTTASWREKVVLGGAAFYDDITVTHTDTEYFNRHYETHFKPELCADPKSDDQRMQIAKSKGSGFNPMYYTYSYKEDARLIEMSFNCSNYQHQLKNANAAPASSFEPVYQTIFLNKKLSYLWTIDDIDQDKVIKCNWWHQLGHRWQHYVRVVPGMMFLQGRNHTLFAGSWTLVNMHEAYRLGADYAKFDDFAQDFFAKYLLLSHGMIFSREERKRKKTF